MSFDAKYPGRCGNCPNGIRPGDLIEYRDDVAVHVTCDTDSPVDLTREVCGDCFTERAANGACLCGVI